MWVLVYIFINGGAVVSAINASGNGHKYDNMYECFEAREELGKSLSGRAGYFDVGTQAICVQVGDSA